MSFFDKLLPKWKHADPAIRAKAVSRLDDQAQLTLIVETDENEGVRLAAVKRLTDQAVLARLARGNSPLNVHAVQVLSDDKILVEVAAQAESAKVRELAVSKIEDKAALQRIAACDVDPWVRFQAKTRSDAVDRTQDVIRESLAKLQVAKHQAAGVAEFFGTLDDISGALVKDRRFRINGGMDEEQEFPASTKAPTTPTRKSETDFPGQSLPHATFLAGRRGENGEAEGGETHTVFYEINIWRDDEDKYQGNLKERRVQVTQDIAAWNRSSRESGRAK